MAETLMTFYNQSPNTSYLQIDGFNAPGDEGPTINAALNFLDKFEDEYESSLSSKKTKLEKQKGKLRGEIDSSTSKRTKEKKEEEIKSIDQKLNDSEKDLNKEYFNNVIKNISDLFFYPEITDQSALDKHTKDTIALKKAKIVKI